MHYTLQYILGNPESKNSISLTFAIIVLVASDDSKFSKFSFDLVLLIDNVCAISLSELPSNELAKEN